MKTVLIVATAAALAAAASADFGSVISSFRLSGTSLPYVTGVIAYYYGSAYWGALYSTGPDYLLQYNESGSIVGSYILGGSLRPTDMDYALGGYRNIAVLDVGRRALLEYVLTTGSFVGSRPVPRESVGYTSLIDWWSFLAVGTWVYRYDRNWSILNSFDTGMDIGAIAHTPYFRNWTRPTLIVAPRGPGLFHCYYATTGSHTASFAVPGSGTRGADCPITGYPIYFYCNRVTPRGMYLYTVDIGGYSVVEPASLGRVKALFR